MRVIVPPMLIRSLGASEVTSTSGTTAKGTGKLSVCTDNLSYRSVNLYLELVL